VTTIEQMKNQSKLHKFFFLVNLNYTMNHLLQHCFKTFGKIQLLIGNMNVVFPKKIKSPLTWLPKPCVNMHAFIKNIIWEQGTYFFLQSEWMPWIGLE
jgi:hypothetical protein